MEPLTLAIVGGASGGAAGTLVKPLVEYGQKWLSSYYRDHRPKAMHKACANTQALINGLAWRVHQLEQSSEITSAVIQHTLEDPQFGILIQKAMLGASQSENASKRELLIDLVVERLKAPAESLFTLTSQLACDAVIHCTENQLKILGFMVSAFIIQPGWTTAHFASKKQFLQTCREWFNHRFQPYKDLHLGPRDLAHLSSLSCASVGRVAGSHARWLSKWKYRDFSLTVADVTRFEVGPVIFDGWKQKVLFAAELTTIGEIIGVLTSDRLCGANPTSLTDWQELH